MVSCLRILHPIVSLLLILSLLPPTSPATSPADAASLAAVKAALWPASIPPGSCLASWDFALDPCDAAFGAHFTCGLRCDAVDAVGNRRVTELTLDPAGYGGTLSPAVWDFTFLETLDLADNRLSGPIPPPPLASAANLRRLDLSRNLLSGELPLLPTALEELYLDGNRISGEISPANLGRRLRRIELQGNNITGWIPDLRDLADLRFFDASDNEISGEFPPASLPSSLVELSLRGNLIEGELAGPAIASLPSIQVMDLSGNRLTGAVPSAAFEHPALEQLNLAGNAFDSVAAPPGIAAAGSRLVAVDLGQNRIEGLLPGFLVAMPRLSAVDLEDNRFTGMIPAEYAVRAAAAEVVEGSVAPFGRLLLSGNYLFGPIPSLMGGMREGSAMVSLANNCLFRCPTAFFFCGGGEQKAPAACREFNPVIP